MTKTASLLEIDVHSQKIPKGEGEEAKREPRLASFHFKGKCFL